jgi:hypothetical protein
MRFQGREIPWKALGAALPAILGCTVLPAIRSGSLHGISEILAVAYGAIWSFVLLRATLHIYEGYLWKGLFWPTSLEIVAVVFWGLLADIVACDGNPQVVRLAVFATVASLLLFVSSTVLERSRERLVDRPGRVRLRRASEVVKESGAWALLCDLFGRLGTRPTEKLSDWFSGADSADGMLSRVSLLALAAAAFLTVGATWLVVAGTVLGLPLSPATDHAGKGSGGGGHNEGGSGGGAAAGGGQTNGGVKGQTEEGEPPSEPHPSACGYDYDPGPEVPEPQRSALMLGWHPVEGIVPDPLEALGSDIAGCPGKPLRIPGLSEWWYAAGYCQSSLRSVVIAPAGAERPVVLLEQAADFAFPLIQEEEFVDAVERFPVGGGDAYVIDTPPGSFVLIRSSSSAGRLGPDGVGEGCDHFDNRDVAYTVVPPSLISGWRSVAAISNGGVLPVSVAHPDGNFEAFVFVGDEGVEAEGRCWHQGSACGVKIEGRWTMGSPTSTDQAEVEELAEP